MTKAQIYRDQTVDEVNALVADARKELFGMVNSKRKENKERKTHFAKQKKKEIARMLTVLREKEIAEKA